MKIRYSGLILSLFMGVSILSGQEEVSLSALYEAGQCDQFVKAVALHSDDSLSAQMCLYSGVCLMELAEYQSALGYLDKAIRKDRDLATGYFFKAETLFHLNRLPEALIQFDNAIHLQPEVADFQISKGHALFQAGRYPEAISCLQKAISLPSCPESAYLLLARAYQENRQEEEAFASFYRALEILDPNGTTYQECLHRLGMAEYLRGNLFSAEAAFNRLLDLNPNDYLGVAKLIQVYFAKGEFQKGMALKMKLYSAFQRGVLPGEMVETGFCFDQFQWEGKRVYAFERFEEPPGYYIKHKFLVTNEKDQVLLTVQTEHTPDASILGKKYILGKVEGEKHTLFEKMAFEDNFNYTELKRAVIRVLEGKSKP